MANDYEKAKKGVFRGMWLLAALTLIEVAISLFGKGHLGYDPSGFGTITIPYFHWEVNFLLAIVAVLLIVLSLYKAYFIIYEFMHMGHEARGLRMTVLMPVLLLVWAIIAFFYEGSAWKENRSKVQDRNQEELGELSPSKNTGEIYKPELKREDS